MTEQQLFEAQTRLKQAKRYIKQAKQKGVIGLANTSVGEIVITRKEGVYWIDLLREPNKIMLGMSKKQAVLWLASKYAVETEG
jgi:hypothetical protein